MTTKLLQKLGTAFILMSFSAQVLSNECHVGMKIKNGIFTQKLRNSTERKLDLKDYAGDQFDANKLTFSAFPKYDNRGRYQKCEIKNLKYAGERFSALGTILKKAAVGTGLFTAGVATIGLTLYALYLDSQSEDAKMSVDPELMQKSKEKDVYVITTYDHLDVSYHYHITRRYEYRTYHPYYHYHYLSCREYHRLRALEAGLIAGTLLIVEAFEVPRNMRSTNQQGPAEDLISEQDCNVTDIKSKLMFDSYLYCGDFKSDAYKGFRQKSSEVQQTVEKALVAIKEGKFKKFRKYLSGEAANKYASDGAVSELRNELIGVAQDSVKVKEDLTGKVPGQSKQLVAVLAGERIVEVECEQDWAYDKGDLYAVENNFIPVNSYKECKISNL